tara:strand:- start:2363 stop:2533 length:171 start_codon:yes stop_codon:yes gene_type:complete
MAFLKGKKTYMIAFLMVLVGLIQALTGEADAIQGIMDNAMILLSGLGFGALRAGVG